MSYKFQLGEFRASGSLIQEGNITSDDGAAGNLAVVSGAVGRFTHLSCSSNSLVIGSTTISEVELGLLDGFADAAVNVGADSLVFFDADNSKLRREDLNDFLGAIVDDSSIELTTNAINVKALGVTNAMLAGSIADSKLSTISTAGKVALSALELDGGTDIGAALSDGDLIIVDDGANGTMRKSTVSRIPTYVFSQVSGDVQIADGGAATIQANAVEGTMLHSNTAGPGLDYVSNALEVNVSGALSIETSKLGISGSIAGNGLKYSGGVDSINDIELDVDGIKDALGGTGIAQADKFPFSDAGATKTVTFSNLEDAIFGNVSGDATIAAGGALTIAAGAVEHGMLAEDIISGQDELAHADIADADELMISDAGTIKRVGVDSLRDHFFGVVSGDATIADGGALTIAANAVEDSMVNDNVATGLAGVGLGATSGVLAVQVSGAVKIASDKVGISGSFADNGLKYIGGEDSILGIELDIDGIKDALGGTGIAQADKFAFSDAGVTKTVTFSNLEDAIFGNVSSQASIAAGGALSLAVAAISGQTEMTGDVADTDELMISDGGVLKRLDFSVLRDAVFNDVSGDATVAAGGALTIAANAVEGSMLNNNIVSGLTDIGAALAATDEIIVSDAGSIKRTDLSRFPTLLAGTGLDDVGDGTMRVSAAQTNITSIINASLSKIGTAADQEYIVFNDPADEIGFFINDSPAMAITATGVAVEGNLTVLGTTTTVNSTTINISQSFTFEGPADAHETILHCGTPIADTTINLPQMAAGTYHLPVLAAASTTAISATPAELNLLDAGVTTTVVTLEDTDNLIIFDDDDSDVAKKVKLSNIMDYVDSMNVQNIDDSGTVQVGMNYFSSLGGAEACTLPASPTVGNVVYIKAPSNCSKTNTITINKAGSQTIDGVTSIILESPYAAVSLCYVAANVWSIF